MAQNISFLSSPLGRRDFLKLVGTGTMSLLLSELNPECFASVSRKPNIIVILVDDMGYADVGFHGCKDIPTPNIDALARQGVQFTSGYVSSPMCSPCRAGLLTGRYQQRFGYEFNICGSPKQIIEEKRGIPLTEMTMAEALKKCGYTTGAVGKWDVGMAPEMAPLKRGFDEFFGFLFGGHNYLSRDSKEFQALMADAEQVKPKDYPFAFMCDAWQQEGEVFVEFDRGMDNDNPMLRQDEFIIEREYLTDAFTRQAVNFIDRHSETPFFLYLPYNAPHAPLQVTQKYLERFDASKFSDGKRRVYAAMISAIDDGVGAIMAKLREKSLDDNTIVFFLNDNGGPPNQNACSNAPLRGAKTILFEGGIRVPFVVRWPDRIPKGIKFDAPVISLDIMATALSVAGFRAVDELRLDGVNLIPYLSGEIKGSPHEYLFWRQANGYHAGEWRAVRHNNWKLLKINENPVQLYDLSTDVGEQNNLAQKHPDKVEELTGVLNKWDSTLAKPLWPDPIVEAVKQYKKHAEK